MKVVYNARNNDLEEYHSPLVSPSENHGYSSVMRSVNIEDVDENCFGDPNLEVCLGEPVEAPVVSPMVVLDAKHTNYSFLPHSKYRNKYHYNLENKANIEQQIMVSVLTPFYNSGKHINNAAKMVFGQSFQLFEWIIVNDGSNDTYSLEQLDKYRNKDPRVTIIDLDTNFGLPGARNQGVKVAKGKYLLLLDPDDMIEQSYLEKAIWFLETHPQYTLMNAWSVGFGHKEYTWARGFQSGDANLHGNEITVATVMRTAALRAVGAFDANLTMGMEDWDLWMRMADNGHWGWTLEEFMFWYRVSPPGKWANIDNVENFNKFTKARQEKYKRAFTKGVPKLSRDPPNKYAPIPDITSYLGPVSVFNNRLSKCKPRVMVILPTMEVGGADQFNYNFLQGLALEGWEITIVATKSNAKNPWLSAFMRVTGDIFVLSNFLEINQYPNFMVYLVESRRPDIVFVTNSESGYLYVPYIKFHCPWATVVDYVHSETPLWKDGGYARYSFGLSDTLDRSVFASEHLRKYVVERGHVASKTATVRIGVDVQSYKANPKHRSEIRSMLGLPDNKMLIIYVARLSDEKQPLLFASVMKELSDRGRDFLAVSIGDGELYDDLNKTVMKYVIQDKVRLWGAVTNKQVSKWMSAADIFFLPSKVEGISLAIYEAMALGVTCVSSLVGGQAELVVDGVGFLVKPGSKTEEEEYVAALDKLVSDPAYTRKLGQASRNRVVAGFSSQDALRQLKKEFCIASQMNSKRIKSQAPVLREYAALVTDYFRLEGEAVGVWKDFVKLKDTHATLLDKINTPPEYPTRPPSPFVLDSKATPESVLKSINLDKLRVVEDVLEEKNIDVEMDIMLKTNMGSYYRKNPKVAIAGFDINAWNKKDNHDVKEWNDKIPYTFKQMQYVAQIPNAYVGLGQAGTVFDYERVFLLKKGTRSMFDTPAPRTKQCEVHKYKKLVSLIQIWSSEIGHLMSEALPRLSLIWKEFKADPEMKLLVPNLPFSHTIFEKILMIDPAKLVWYDYGDGWNPCKTYFAETLYIPTPNPTGNPIREQVEAVRKIFVPQYKEKNLIVYFSRKGLERAVSNEDKLIDAIRDALPETDELVVFTPNHNLEEVFEHMTRAKAIIGSHGSTLAPMVWADKGTVVIEYLHEAPWLQWWATATACEHDYWMVPVENTKHESPSFHAPIELSVKTLMVALGYEEMESVEPVSSASNDSSSSSSVSQRSSSAEDDTKTTKQETKSKDKVKNN